MIELWRFRSRLLPGRVATIGAKPYIIRAVRVCFCHGSSQFHFANAELCIIRHVNHASEFYLCRKRRVIIRICSRGVISVVSKHGPAGFVIVCIFSGALKFGNVRLEFCPREQLLVHQVIRATQISVAGYQDGSF